MIPTGSISLGFDNQKTKAAPTEMQYYMVVSKQVPGLTSEGWILTVGGCISKDGGGSTAHPTCSPVALLWGSLHPPSPH